MTSDLLLNAFRLGRMHWTNDVPHSGTHEFSSGAEYKAYCQGWDSSVIEAEEQAIDDNSRREHCGDE